MINWAQISSGATFEALTHQILLCECGEGVIPFDRPGRDGGQDARTRDGSIVFQAKYRADPFTMNDAIQLAREEFARIKEYRQASSTVNCHWRAARQWILIAPFRVNANDARAWEETVIPLFDQIGLQAAFWHRAVIESKLTQHQHLIPFFFEGRCRVFLTLSEARAMLCANDRYMQGSLDATFVGRDQDLARVDTFAGATGEVLLPVIGHGGIGKTRFLFEAGRRLQASGRYVLWANAQTMERDPQWFSPALASREVTVLIDEPGTPGLLAAIKEQASGSTHRAVRFIVACRSERTPVLQELSVDRNPSVAQPIQLQPLRTADAISLLNTVAGYEVDNGWANEVARWTGGYPLWIAVVGCLARDQRHVRNLPYKIRDVAAKIIDSAIRDLPVEIADKAPELLRWLALYGTISLDNSELINFLERRGIRPDVTERLLRELAQRQLVKRQGLQGRSFSVTPAPLGEHIVAEWLLDSTNGTAFTINMAGKSVIDMLLGGPLGDVLPDVESILSTLARMTDTRLDANNQSALFSPIFDRLHDMARSGQALNQLQAVDILEHVGYVDICRTADIIAGIRTSGPGLVAGMATDAEERRAKHLDVVNRCSTVLRSLLDSASERQEQVNLFEQAVEQYLFDFDTMRVSVGQQPQSVSPQIIEDLGKHNRHVEEYRVLAYEYLHRLLERTAQGAQVPNAEVALLMQLGQNVCDPIWETVHAAGMEITWRFWHPIPGTPSWEHITGFIQFLLAALKTNSALPDSVSTAIWRIVAEARRAFSSALQHRVPQDAPYRGDYEEVVLRVLRETVDILSARELSVGEVGAASTVWQWHVRYGAGEEGHDVALACRDKAIHTPLIQKYRLDVFLDGSDFYDAPSSVSVLASVIRPFQDANDYQHFFDTLCAFVQGVGHFNGTCLSAMGTYVVQQTGWPAVGVQSLNDYVGRVIGARHDYPLGPAWHFSAAVIRERMRQVRTTDPASLSPLFSAFYDRAADRNLLVRSVYGDIHPGRFGPLTAEDAEILCGLPFPDTPDELIAVLGMLAPFVLRNRELVRGRIDTILTRLPADQQAQGLRSVVRALSLAVEWHASTEVVSDHAHWCVERASGMVNGFNVLEAVAEGCNERGRAIRLPWSDYMTFLEHQKTLAEATHNYVRVPDDLNPADVFQINIGTGTGREEITRFIDFGLQCSATMHPSPIRQVKGIDADGTVCLSIVAERVDALSARASVDDLFPWAQIVGYYPDSCEAWRIGAVVLCNRASHLPVADRHALYRALLPRHDAMVTWTRGSPPPHLVTRAETARMLCASEYIEILREYREFAVQMADAELRDHSRLFEMAAE